MKSDLVCFFGLLLQAGLLMLPNFFATQIHSVRIKAFSFGLAKCYQINIRRMKNTKCEMRCDVMLNKSIHHANAKLAAKWRSDTPCSLHAYIFMIEWYFFITFSLLYTFFWLNPHNHSGVVTPQCRKGLYKPPCVSFIQLIFSHSLTHSLSLRLFTSNSYRTIGCHKTFFSVVLAVKWTKRIWENVYVLERSQKRYNRTFVRVDYVLCSTTFLLLLLFHRVRVCVWVCVCVHFNLRFNSNVPIAQNFIYIARLGIVIEQKIVLTFRIIFTMWNSLTEWKLEQ